MISFRFHLVSLTAVFLALGLGVLTGTTVLNRGIVAGLESQTDRLAAQLDEARGEVASLRSEIEVWSRFGEETMGDLIGDRLEGTEVIMVSQDGTDATALDQVREVVETAGATVRLEILVRERMALENDGDLEALAETIGVDEDLGPDAVVARAAERLADQLAFGTAGTDILEGMASSGFIAREGEPAVEGDRTRPEEAPMVLLTAGGSGRPVVPPSIFLVPFAARLADDGWEVAASEASQSDYPFVEALRDSEAADRIVTQDNVDQLPGAVSLILAVEDLLEEGENGHYGVKSGASTVLAPLS